MAIKGQKFRSYDQEFKLKAVKMYLEEGKGKRAVAKELNLDQSYVARWVKSYKQHGVDVLKQQRGKYGGRPKKLSMEEELIKLKAENEYLKKLLIVEGWAVPKIPDLE